MKRYGNVRSLETLEVLILLRYILPNMFYSARRYRFCQSHSRRLDLCM